MSTSLTQRRQRCAGERILAALLASAAILLLAPALAAAQDTQRGAEILRAVDDGERSCDDLQTADFEQVGEYVMSRMAGSEQAHRSMNAMMSGMLGSSGAERMHVAMGQRFTGCGRGGFPAGVAGMMNGFGGMMGMMGGYGGYGTGGPGNGAGTGMMGGYGPGMGMMGGYGPGMGMMGGSGYGPGYGANGVPGATMMGFNRDNDDDDSAAAWIAIGVIVLVLGIGAAAFFTLRRRPGSTPLDALAQSFARGEISAEEFEQRRALLQGGS